MYVCLTLLQRFSQAWRSGVSLRRTRSSGNYGVGQLYWPRLCHARPATAPLHLLSLKHVPITTGAPARLDPPDHAACMVHDRGIVPFPGGTARIHLQLVPLQPQVKRFGKLVELKLGGGLLIITLQALFLNGASITCL